jgi:hypothetical protein
MESGHADLAELASIMVESLAVKCTGFSGGS